MSLLGDSPLAALEAYLAELRADETQLLALEARALDDLTRKLPPDLAEPGFPRSTPQPARSGGTAALRAVAECKSSFAFMVRRPGLRRQAEPRERCQRPLLGLFSILLARAGNRGNTCRPRERLPARGTSAMDQHETRSLACRAGSRRYAHEPGDRAGVHEHRGEPGGVQGRLGDGHLLGRRPVHAEAAACSRRDASGRGRWSRSEAGRMIEVRGQVKQVERTYSVVGLMNEHQLSLGETTTGGRRELVDRQGQLDYDALMLADPPACEDRPRGDQRSSTRLLGVRLRQLRRDVLDRRQE